MAVTLDDALDALNITEADDLAEIQLYVDAANEWVADTVTDTSPSYVKVGTLFLIEHLWQSQRGPGSAAPVAGGGDDTIEVSGVAYAIPHRVLELLGRKLKRATPIGSFPDAAAWPDPVERRRGW